MMDPVRISKIEIKDILGTRLVEFSPGTLTVLSGQNGSGKSSILRALSNVVDGGWDPMMVRNGAKFGEIRIALSNGTLIRKRISDRGADLSITDVNGDPIKPAKAYVESLAEATAIDPVRLLLAKPKELAALLIETMSPTFTAAEIRAALGNAPELRDLPREGIALDDLARFREETYDRRKDCNVIVRDAQGTVESLEKTLPAEPVNTDWSGQAKALEARQAELQQSVRTELQGVQHDYDLEIGRINRQAEEARENARKALDDARAAVTETSRPQLEEVATDLAVARENVNNAGRVAELRRQIELARKKYRENSLEADRLTRAIEALDQLKKEKLDSLPIPGLEVRNDRVFFKGVAFEHVNTAMRVSLAFSICAMRAGDSPLPFMLLDNTECLDQDTWAAFVEGANASGFQVLAARVGPGALTIECSPAAELATA